MQKNTHLYATNLYAEETTRIGPETQFKYNYNILFNLFDK
jgi:hypothetical protein